ncbi:hypothetical protein BH10PSE2_BH10PSE2_07720 [soil metagenome]
MNLILASHCNFAGNSAMHVFSIAEALIDLGHRCLVLVPDSPETIEAHGAHRFDLMTYDEARTSDLMFDDGRGPDLVHAWTPRDHVRRLVRDICALTGCPYVVHMEDHEEQILSDEIKALDIETVRCLPNEVIAGLIGVGHRSHPVLAQGFINGAIGYTCLIEALGEFAAKEQEVLTFWPGFDANFSTQGRDRAAVRASYGLDPNETVILYSGNVHLSIVDDISALYGAVALLRRQGRRVRLVRTGWNYSPLPLGSQALEAMDVLDLGFIPREDLPALVDAADILVQPGKVNTFNSYRFPSKLPEFLVSGRPVLLPRTNIGIELKDAIEAFHLGESGVFDIAGCVAAIMDMPDKGRAVGAAGRKFALKYLTWKNAAHRLDQFYKKVLKRSEQSITRRDPGRSTAEAESPRFPVDLIAFYLPQFHSIPENDRWWGQGFTEWTNVARGRAMFAGHDQPRRPADLGYYDLRLPEVMSEQARLARAHGVSGFCFYYYWFDGKRLLETPLDNWMRGGPDFPFTICWANEPWSRRWDGSNAEVLMDQPYTPGFAEAFICDILPILKDPRYIRVDGAPLLMIYKASDLPNPLETVEIWRRIARENGVPRLHIVATQSFGISDPRPFGFDAAVEFSPPHVDRMLLDPTQARDTDNSFNGYLEDYISVAMRSINAEPTDYVRYRGLFPRWDNTARRQSAGHIFINDTAKAYGTWLRHLTWDALVNRNRKAPLIFVNAWNEWAEGTYLEPDETYGYGLLQVTKAALGEGVIDFVRGRTMSRDRVFTQSVSILPKLALSGSGPPSAQNAPETVY